MRKIREVIRLKSRGLTHREIGRSLAISPGAVSSHLTRAREIGATWSLVEPLSDEQTEELFERDTEVQSKLPRVPVPFEHIHQELSRTGVTLQLLWQEYLETASLTELPAAVPYRYSQFCARYTEWRKRQHPTLRRIHLAGEKAFIDYSGKRLAVIDSASGIATPVELFVMVLGASNYTFAEATWTQTLPDFTSSVVRGLEFFGGVPKVLVPDQLKSAVQRSDRYDPVINDAFADLGLHYSASVVPARPRKPRDKAKVEAAVLIVQRWILARLRNQKFFSLQDLNAAIRVLLDDLNSRPFKRLPGSRLSRFLEVEKPALQPLPSQRFELQQRRGATVRLDYHVEFRGSFFSVPSALVGRRVELRATAALLEVFHAGSRVASHSLLELRPGSVQTSDEHRPLAHRIEHWSIERTREWATTHGENLALVMERTVERFQRPEDAERACQGLRRLADRFGAQALEIACRVALRAAPSLTPHRRDLEALLKNGLPIKERPARGSEAAAHVHHENIRGADYYDRKETIH